VDAAYAVSRGILTIVRTLNTDASGPLSYDLTVVATNPGATGGTASVPVVATASAPARTTRYPTTNSLLSLAAQATRQTGLWFADLFPPQSFNLTSQYAGLDNVRYFSPFYFRIIMHLNKIF
jgi:hypothetical protein